MHDYKGDEYTGIFRKKSVAPGMIRFSVANPVMDDFSALQSLLSKLQKDRDLLRNASLSSADEQVILIRESYKKLAKHLSWSLDKTLDIANKLHEKVEGNKFLKRRISKIMKYLNINPDDLRFLEFIPGIGMKFFRNGQLSGSLVAMESLAGQGDDHNYFKYPFSPDFSYTAPAGFNRSIDLKDQAPNRQRAANHGFYDEARTKIFNRYMNNPVNNLVMIVVGKRFKQMLDAHAV
jgi:hypothetical protein